MAILTREETGLSTFEPVVKWNFLMDIPGIPTYAVKKYSYIRFTRGKKGQFEIEPITIELCNTIDPDMTNLVYDALIKDKYPSISCIKISLFSKHVYKIIELKGNAILSIDLIEGDFASNEDAFISLVIQPSSIHFTKP